MWEEGGLVAAVSLGRYIEGVRGAVGRGGFKRLRLRRLPPHSSLEECHWYGEFEPVPRLALEAAQLGLLSTDHGGESR